MIGKRDRQFKAFEVAIGEHAAGRDRYLGRHADHFQESVGFLAIEPARRRPKRKASPMVGHQRHLDVFADRHGGHRRGDLKGPPDAELEDSLGGQADNASSAKQDLACVGRALAADRVEACALAGAVRSDDGDKFSGRHVQTNVVHGKFSP